MTLYATHHSNSLGEIAVSEYYKRRFAAQLQRTFLQVALGTGRHDLLSDRGGASESDLTHFWVVNNSLTAYTTYNNNNTHTLPT